MTKFIGRNKQLDILKESLALKKASLIVLRGRRRIGKSRLSEEFGQAFKHAFYFSGLAPSTEMTAADQLSEFIRQLHQQRIPSRASRDWGDLFYDLAHFCQTGPVLIVLDEITWMAQGSPTFLSKLKVAWDMHFKKNNQLILLLSGSDSAWIEANIMSKTGFFGRISIRMKLTELSLYHCAKFWGKQNKHISAYEKLKVLSVTGGVPRYLEEINPMITAEENIYRLCYRSEGVLFNEFDDIFNDLFQRRGEYYREIVQCIADGHQTIDDIAAALHRKKGGDLTRALTTLCQDDFIERSYSWHVKTGNVSKISRYRLRDNYLRFYLKYILPYQNSIQAGEMNTLPRAWDSIIGLQFENLVLNNRTKIHVLLGISAQELIMNNPYLQTKTQLREKCQIDYLIQTKFNTLYVCEIKFSKNEIDTRVIHEMKTKIEKLAIPKHFSVRAVLIHVNGVTDSVIAEEYFSNIIDFSEFFEMSE